MRKNLKKTRLSLGLDVCSVAKTLGISESHYYKIEAGMRNPNMELAKKIATLYNSTIEDLFFTDSLDETSKTHRVS